MYNFIQENPAVAREDALQSIQFPLGSMISCHFKTNMRLSISDW